MNRSATQSERVPTYAMVTRKGVNVCRVKVKCVFEPIGGQIPKM